LLIKGIKYFLAPSALSGLLSVFFPFLYAVVPAFESGLCFCSLKSPPMVRIPANYATLMVINTLMFYGVNWIFLLSNILMLYRIRHINDGLKVREEMGYIVKIWTFFCFIQYTLYLLDKIAVCNAE
jgi:hypothetical protein